MALPRVHTAELRTIYLEVIDVLIVDPIESKHVLINVFSQVDLESA